MSKMILVIGLISLISCSVTEVSVVETDALTVVSSQPNISFRNSLSPEPNLIVGGQPSQGELTAISEAGYRTVINLRGLGESSGFDEARLVESSGMTYHAIPVAGASGLTQANAARMRQILSDTSAWPVVVHCASGNRVGALFAIDASANGASLEEALAKGREYGMTSLSSVVVELLGE